MNFFKKVMNSLSGSQSNNTEVDVIHINIPSKYLERGVKVDVFLPPQYDRDKKRHYPTIYFNDGQDMLALGMYDTLNRLYTEGALQHTIIVAMYCNENRINEYGTARQADYKNRGNKALSYTNFVLFELMPYIHESFRCLKNATDTAFAGFSLGAL
ncbi:MAG: hypothetical protein JNL70_21850, partial [Saprospiraceae bacterium]|nr:hypothetical protein [Saprospiraceae bacterium]